MKHFIPLVLILCLPVALSAQLQAFGYLNKAPAIPDKVCGLKAFEQDAFSNTVSDLSNQIIQDIKDRSKAATEYAKSHEAEMKAGIMRNAGLSETDIQRMNSGKDMTEAEKQEMASRMMKEKANLSMGDAKNLQNMSQAEKEAWAQGYAAEQLNSAGSDSRNNIAEASNGRSMYELLAEQTALREKINGMENKTRQSYMDMDREAEKDKVLLENELKPLIAELRSINDGEGSTQADVDHANRVIKEIHNRQDKFCEKWTPRMMEFLVQAKGTTQKTIPDYDRLEEIQAEVTAAQTGTDKLTAGKGVLSLQAVEQYLGYLKETFRYKLYRGE